MKKIKSTLLILLLCAAASNSPLKSDAQVAVNFQVFYDDLSPYGNWVNYPGYGYSWVPNAGAGFRPYVTSGHWVYSDAGWVWVSDYDWGWAPFHYGTWVDDPSYGWMWIPGYDWAPAWVTWGSYNGYYGWAPLAPGFSLSVGYYPPIDRWCFVEPRYMTVGGFGNHFYVAHGNRIAIGGNVVITNVQRISTVRNTANYSGHGYFAGPQKADFERVAHTTVTPVSIKESNRSGRTQVGGNAISIYRPKVNAGTKVYSRPAKATTTQRTAPVQNAQQSATHGQRTTNAAAHPAYQQPQRQKTVNNGPAPSHAQPSPQPQQHQPQPASRPAVQPHQEAAPREQAPRPEEREGGRPRL